MNNSWSWIVQNWKALGISVPAAIGGIRWIYISARAHRQKKLDANVLEALGDRELWSPKAHPMTGAGDLGIRASEIADHLQLRLDIVADSLERLEVQGKTRMGDGTMDNPAPYWYIVRR